MAIFRRKALRTPDQIAVVTTSSSFADPDRPTTHTIIQIITDEGKCISLVMPNGQAMNMMRNTQAVLRVDLGLMMGSAFNWRGMQG